MPRHSVAVTASAPAVERFAGSLADDRAQLGIGRLVSEMNQLLLGDGEFLPGLGQSAANRAETAFDEP